MTKKQKNILLGVIIAVVAGFALFFSDDSTSLINFGDSQAKPSENVYEKEVIIGPTITTEAISEEVDVSITSEEKESTALSTNSYQVVKVVDGDTIDVNMDGKVERLRLIGIDTPETVDPRKPVQCFGKEASNKAKELLTGKSVGLEADGSQGEQDKYGRLLRYVILPDGTNFNLFMIRQGYAHEYTYDEAYKYQAEFKAAQVEAQNAEKGLWSPETCQVTNDFSGQFACLHLAGQYLRP